MHIFNVSKIFLPLSLRASLPNFEAQVLDRKVCVKSRIPEIGCTSSNDTGQSQTLFGGASDGSTPDSSLEKKKKVPGEETFVSQTDALDFT